MTIVRVGSTGKYADGWEAAFGKKRTRVTTTPRKKVTKKAKSSKVAKKRN